MTKGGVVNIIQPWNIKSPKPDMMTEKANKKISVNCCKTSRPGQTGFILIAVLWISLLLSIFALNMSTRSRLQATQALNIQEMTILNHVLSSGLSMGFHEYRKYLDNRGLLNANQELESWSGLETDIWFPVYEPRMVEIEDTSVGIQIINPGGKLDINMVDTGMLQEIVALCGAESGTEITSITNSILDWIDEDDLKRLEGAEKKYYLSLSKPYLPKNAPMQDMRELLMVRGVSRDIFYGNRDHPGLIHFFSIHGSPEKMDINSAAPEALASLGDLPEEVVRDIQTRRSSSPLTSVAELGDLIPYGHFDQLDKYFTVAETDKIMIRAFMAFDDEIQGRSVSRYYKAGR